MSIENNFVATTTILKAKLVELLSQLPSEFTTRPSLDEIVNSSCMSVEVKHSDLGNVNLYISERWNGIALNERGDQYAKMDLEFQVSWASYGSNPPALAHERARMFMEVAAIGIALESEFGGKELYILASTAEQVAERELDMTRFFPTQALAPAC
jgi:hypothetical protein